MNKQSRTYLLQAILFLITLITTTLAGAEWQFNKYLFWGDHTLSYDEILKGFYFSGPFLGILTVHEFGHYITAQVHRVKVSLPYYIPLWFGFVPMPSIGTMGAFIRIKEFITSRTKYFDIGIAGPLAGFVVAVGVLFYGFTHLPPPEHIFTIHPEFEEFGEHYDEVVYTYEYQRNQDSLQWVAYQKLDSISHVQNNEPDAWEPTPFQAQPQYVAFTVGKNLLFELFRRYIAPEPDRIPNYHEVIHYPWLFAGYLALFFTALNLLPIGQLDGGHILYGLIGSKWHAVVSRSLFIILVLYAGMGLITPYDEPDSLLFNAPLYIGFLYILFSRMYRSITTNLLVAVAVFTTQFALAWVQPGWAGDPFWMVYALLLGRFLGLYHPPALYDTPLGVGRQLLGWLTLIVFILCFSPAPFSVQ
jgi:Zn-dependent protease